MTEDEFPQTQEPDEVRSQPQASVASEFQTCVTAQRAGAGSFRTDTRAFSSEEKVMSHLTHVERLIDCSRNEFEAMVIDASVIYRWFMLVGSLILALAAVVLFGRSR